MDSPIVQYNNYQLKYKPGDTLINLSDPNQDPQSIDEILITKDGIYYDFYFQTVSAEDVHDSTKWTLKDS